MSFYPPESMIPSPGMKQCVLLAGFSLQLPGLDPVTLPKQHHHPAKKKKKMELFIYNFPETMKNLSKIHLIRFYA